MDRISLGVRGVRSNPGVAGLEGFCAVTRATHKNVANAMPARDPAIRVVLFTIVRSFKNVSSASQVTLSTY
jgi:hypothetical protein